MVPGSHLAGSPNTAETEQKTGRIQVVEFVLGNGLVAINLFDVKEVVEFRSITKLPNVDPCIKGIIDLRGDVTTIIDLKHLLNISGPDELPAESKRIIVLDDTITGSRTGILVDDVTSVSTFDEDRVDRTSISNAKDGSAIIGIVKRKLKIRDKERNDLIVWIDIRKLLSGVARP